MKQKDLSTNREFTSDIPFEYPSFLAGELGVLAGAGFANPVLFGGALRDIFLNLPKFNDLDIRLRTSKDIKVRELFNTISQLDTGTYKPSEEISLFFQERTGILINLIKKRPHSANLKGYKNVNGRQLDFDLSLRFKENNDTPHFEYLEPIRNNESPICAVSMDVNGKTYMDVKFPEHAEGLIYAPQIKSCMHLVSSYERYKYLEGKIPGLRLQHTVKNTVLLNAYLYSVNNAPWAVDVAKMMRDNTHFVRRNLLTLFK